MLKTIPFVTKIIDDMINENPERYSSKDDIFNIADLGTASGTNSIPIFIKLIEQLRMHSNGRNEEQGSTSFEVTKNG